MSKRNRRILIGAGCLLAAVMVFIVGFGVILPSMNPPSQAISASDILADLIMQDVKNSVGNGTQFSDPVDCTIGVDADGKTFISGTMPLSAVAAEVFFPGEKPTYIIPYDGESNAPCKMLTFISLNDEGKLTVKGYFMFGKEAFALDLITLSD